MIEPSVTAFIGFPFALVWCAGVTHKEGPMKRKSSKARRFPIGE